MARILLTHTPDMLRNYYGDRALAALRAIGGTASTERSKSALVAGVIFMAEALISGNCRASRL